jgi:hypothetical protein
MGSSRRAVADAESGLYKHCVLSERYVLQYRVVTFVVPMVVPRYSTRKYQIILIRTVALANSPSRSFL